MIDKIDNIHSITNFNDKELSELASEIRNVIIEQVSRNGGHLASNLGLVELTISLFKNFNFDNDKIIFDVGHQCYAYKILTGRKNDMINLRKYKGISGFPKSKESKYDFFNTGHASNSISAAIGMARARDLSGKKYNIITLIGDGAMTGGMTFEALNDLGDRKTKMLIILNDNGMSISNNVGGFSNCLDKIRINPFYNRLKKRAHYRLDKIKSKKISNVIHNVKSGIKNMLLPSMYFENLGIKYIGPIDGHNIKKLNKVLSKIKNMDEPVVLHVKTIKGKGYKYSERCPNKYHAVGAFDIKTGVVNNDNSSYSSTFGNKLCSIASHNKKIVAITAAMKDGTGLSKFSEKFPKRFFDVGIAEEHAVTLAAGFAISGYKPYFAVYSTFLQRSFDQIIEDVCMQNLPVTFMIDRSGLVGADGETHHGIFDSSYLNLIPNLTIMQPKSLIELEKMLDFSVNFKGPLAIKYCKGKNNYKFNEENTIEYGKWEIVSNGNNLVIIATGRMVELAMMAKEKIEKDIMIINARFIKPIDTKLLDRIIKNNNRILVLEENNIIGGLSTSVMHYTNKIINIMGINDRFVEQGSIDELLKDQKISVNDICKKINKILKEDIK